MKTLTGIINTLLLFGMIFLMFLLCIGCRTKQQVTAQSFPVILENSEYEGDTIRVISREVERTQQKSKEQTKESTTEKVTVVVNYDGDTIRTDREKTTVIDHWLMIENVRLQAKIDSLIFNQALKEKIEIPVPYPVEVEVEREFTAWEKFRLKVFWWLFGGFVLSAGWNFRKPILTLAKRFIK